MRYTVLATILFATIIGLSACHKSSGNIDPGSSGNNAALRKAMAALGTPMQTFSVNAGTSSTIIGAQGTRLHFSPNSFKSSSGAIINGTVEITLLELYKPGDMIAHSATTAMKNGTLLTTGGQIYVTASQNGQPLSTDGYGIDFRQPATDSQAMSIFIGDRNSQDSTVQWTETNVPSVPGTTDSFNYFYYSYSGIPQFGRINCDRLSNASGPGTKVKVHVPGVKFNTSNTFIGLILPDVNAATYLTQYLKRTYFESRFSYESPVGLRFKIVLVSLQDNTWYYDKQEGVITEGMQIYTSPQVTTGSAIMNNLKNL